jgi:hypothetical protein
MSRNPRDITPTVTDTKLKMEFLVLESTVLSCIGGVSVGERDRIEMTITSRYALNGIPPSSAKRRESGISDFF